jgi:hypothetical protein
MLLLRIEKKNLYISTWHVEMFSGFITITIQFNKFSRCNAKHIVLLTDLIEFYIFHGCVVYSLNATIFLVLKFLFIGKKLHLSSSLHYMFRPSWPFSGVSNKGFCYFCNSLVHISLWFWTWSFLTVTFVVLCQSYSTFLLLVVVYELLLTVFYAGFFCACLCRFAIRPS